MPATQKSCQVGSIAFEATTLDRAVEDAIDLAISRTGTHLHFANAWSIALAADDDNLRLAFGSGTNFPDGKPVVWAMRSLLKENKQHRAERIDGPTFFEQVLEKGVSHQLRHYFYGSTPETLEKLVENAEERFPGIQIAGTASPPFREPTREDLLKEASLIAASNADFVWVGLGTPKQDKAAAQLAPLYPAVYACVGAAFDYTAGNLRGAPQWVQNSGLGWLFRWIQEPRRLWRRYTYGNVKFISIVLSQRWRRGRVR